MTFREMRVAEQISRLDPGVAETIYHRHLQRRPQIDLWLDAAREELAEQNQSLTECISLIRTLERQDPRPDEDLALQEVRRQKMERLRNELVRVQQDLTAEAEEIDLARPHLERIVQELEAQRNQVPEIYADTEDYQVVQAPAEGA